MPFVEVVHVDMHWSVRALSDEEASKLESDGLEVAFIEGAALAAWFRHRDETAAWNTFWRAVSNDMHVRAERRKQYEIVFELPSIGNVRRGPFALEVAVSERHNVTRVDPEAKIRNIETGEEL